MWYDYEELDYVGDTYYLHETNEINLFCPNTNTNTHTDSKTTTTTTTYSYDTTPTTSPSHDEYDPFANGEDENVYWRAKFWRAGDWHTF